MIESDPEVQTVLHFDLSGLPASWSRADVLVPLHCTRNLPAPGEVEVYAFAGDGEVSVDEGVAGTQLTYLVGLQGEYPVLEIHVTTAVRELLEQGESILALRLRAPAGKDEFAVGGIGGVEEPMIRVQH